MRTSGRAAAIVGRALVNRRRGRADARGPDGERRVAGPVDDRLEPRSTDRKPARLRANGEGRELRHADQPDPGPVYRTHHVGRHRLGITGLGR
jgi:hypothetical protein